MTDYTLMLPDEILEWIFLKLPISVLHRDIHQQVCRRWYHIAKQSISLHQLKKATKWDAYRKRIKHPQTLRSYSWLRNMAVGPDNNIYAGVADGVAVWSKGVRVRTLPQRKVLALIVASDNNVYSAEKDHVIRVWSGTDGILLRTLKDHQHDVKAIVEGHNGKIYSCAEYEHSIRVWSVVDGSLLATLSHKNALMYGDGRVLAVGQDGKIYVGDYGKVQVWNKNDTFLRLLQDSTSPNYEVTAIVVDNDRNVYSCTLDSTIRVWSETAGTLLYVHRDRFNIYYGLALGPHGNVYCGTQMGLFELCLRPQQRFYICPVKTDIGVINHVVVGSDNKIYTGDSSGIIRVW